MGGFTPPQAYRHAYNPTHPKNYIRIDANRTTVLLFTDKTQLKHSNDEMKV